LLLFTVTRSKNLFRESTGRDDARDDAKPTATDYSYQSGAHILALQKVRIMERSDEETADLGHLGIEAGRNRDAALSLAAEIVREEEEKREVEPLPPDPFEDELEVDLHHEEREVLLPRHSSKTRPPPLARQGNVEPTPGAYRVSPGRTVTRASAEASSQSYRSGRRRHCGAAGDAATSPGAGGGRSCRFLGARRGDGLRR
jgi:hypothetical protein